MPSWNQLLKEIQGQGQVGPLDKVRRRYLAKLSRYTGRNTIAYYSGWLSHPRPSPVLSVNDEDKNAFMSTVHKLDRDRGLDLLLHTPGGDLAAAESLVDYLRKMFGTDIRAVIPQLAMSAGTMMACACKTILMGKESNLGPIDPQINGLPANGVISEFKEALRQIKEDQAAVMVWQPIIGKYHPTFLGSCQQAIDWSGQIVKEWLLSGMLVDCDDRESRADKIVYGLSSAEETFNHARHIHVERLEELGLAIERLEEDSTLQDLVLTVHHAFMHTFAGTPALKIVENQNGSAVVRLGANVVPQA